VDHQSVTFAVWLGIPLLALIGAIFSLWRTRRTLRQVQISHCVTQARFSQTPVTPLNSSSIAS
jgi:hypothetical protein